MGVKSAADTAVFCGNNFRYLAVAAKLGRYNHLTSNKEDLMEYSEKARSCLQT